MGRLGRLVLLTIRQLELWSVLVFGVLGAEAAIPKPPYPVIFVHGIYADACMWDELARRLIREGWTYGGEHAPNYQSALGPGAKNCLLGTPTRANADFYTLSFSSNYQLNYREQGAELKQVIDLVLRQTGQDRVILIAHSMGGLASRAYLEFFTDPQAPNVQHLITFGTPHRGSDLARRCREQLIGFCLLLQKDPNSIGVVQLVPTSSQLYELNNLSEDGAARNLPAAALYTSIVVRSNLDRAGDGVVSAESQNLAGIPSFSEVLWGHRHRVIEKTIGVCLRPTAHECEATDANVWDAIFEALATEDVAIELASSRNPIALGESFTISLQPRPPRATVLRRLYLALLQPTGSISFQQRLDQEFSWVPDMRPAREFTPLTDRNVLEAARFRENASRGVYRYYALFTAEGTDPTDRINWRSNVAMIPLYVGVPLPPPPRGKFIYVSSHQLTPTRFDPPSELWRVEIHPEGEDQLIGTIRTATGEWPLIADLALTPGGTLYGISSSHLYEINTTTAVATPVGPLVTQTLTDQVPIGGLVALASDATGQLFAANHSAGQFRFPAFFRVDRTTGAVSSVAIFSSIAMPGASGDIAFAPDGRIYMVREPDGFCSLFVSNCAETLVSFDLSRDLLLGILLTQYVGSLRRSGVYGISFVGSDLYGFTTDADGNGSLVRFRIYRPEHYIGGTDVEVIRIRPLGFQASGAALRLGR